MTGVARVWSMLSRARRKFGSLDDWEEGRLRWVREHAPGKSFADIGGMFKYVGDIAFLAEEHGAGPVTLFDVGDPDIICAGHPEWGWFSDKRDSRGSQVRYVQGDLEDHEAVAELGPHDVCFFSGVLYHTPNPFRQLMHLRAVTRELAYISTLTIPEIPGFPQACVFYPYLSASDREPFAAGYEWRDDLWAIGTPVDERPMYGYGNCWWGITVSALEAMLRAARFDVVERRSLPGVDFLTELVVRPIDAAPMLPPITYFRDRGRALRDEGTRLPFDDYYAER